MSDFEMQDGRISIFPNSTPKSDSSPTHYGKCKVGGKEYKISLWRKESERTGLKFLSGTISLPEDFKGSSNKSSNTPNMDF
jgi:hypothetical protein